MFHVVAATVVAIPYMMYFILVYPPLAVVPFVFIPFILARFLIIEPYIELLKASQKIP
jgi:hypothetical protein